MNVILSRKAGGGGIHKIKVGGCKNQCLSIFFFPNDTPNCATSKWRPIRKLSKRGAKSFSPRVIKWKKIADKDHKIAVTMITYTFNDCSTALDL